MTFKLTDIGDKVRAIADRQTKRIQNHYNRVKSESEYWKEMEKGAGDWRLLMSDPRYPSAMKFMNETKKILDNQMKSYLNGNFPNYTREERTDKAVIPAVQSQIIEYLMNEPDRVIDLIKERK